MRCRCCNDPRTKFVLGDYYCMSCVESIKKAIKEDREVYEDWK